MFKKRKYNEMIPGFTFTELLVVLIIIGILLLLAIPNLMPLISKAKEVEAKEHLSHVHTLEKSYFYMNSKYCSDLSEIDYEPAKLTTEGGTGNYRIEIVSASQSGFVARASAIVDFDGDGAFNVWEIDQDKNLKEVTKD